MAMIPPDPSQFKPPHTWATYVPSRTTHFKTHSSFGVAKSSVRACLGGFGSQGRWHGAWVFRWDDENDEWVLTHYIANYDPAHPDTADFLGIKIASKRAIKGPSEAQVDAALASIASVGT